MTNSTPLGHEHNDGVRPELVPVMQYIDAEIPNHLQEKCRKLVEQHVGVDMFNTNITVSGVGTEMNATLRIQDDAACIRYIAEEFSLEERLTVWEAIQNTKLAKLLGTCFVASLNEKDVTPITRTIDSEMPTELQARYSALVRKYVTSGTKIIANQPIEEFVIRDPNEFIREIAEQFSLRERQTIIAITTRTNLGRVFGAHFRHSLHHASHAEVYCISLPEQTSTAIEASVPSINTLMEDRSITNALGEQIAYLKNKKDYSSLSPEQLQVAARQENGGIDVLKYLDSSSELFQQTACAVFEAIRDSLPYQPTTTESEPMTDGSTPELTAEDKRNIRAQLSFAMVAIESFLTKSNTMMDQMGYDNKEPMAVTVNQVISYSVFEALILDYLNHRFPQLFAMEDDHQGTRYIEHIVQAKNSKVRAFLEEIKQIRADIEAEKHNWPQEPGAIYDVAFRNQLACLGQLENAFLHAGSLAMQAETVKMPSYTESPEEIAFHMTVRAPLKYTHVIPATRGFDELEDQSDERIDREQWFSAGYTTLKDGDNLLTRKSEIFTSRVLSGRNPDATSDDDRYGHTRLNSRLFCHHPRGEACLTHQSLIPLTAVFGAKSPMSIMSRFMRRQINAKLENIEGLLSDAKLTQDVRTHANKIGDIHLMTISGDKSANISIAIMSPETAAVLERNDAELITPEMVECAQHWGITIQPTDVVIPISRFDGDDDDPLPFEPEPDPAEKLQPA